MAHRSGSDLPAAITGFVVGASLIFALMVAIVQMTNSKYASEAAGAASESTR